jgi:hypothetical protein
VSNRERQGGRFSTGMARGASLEETYNDGNATRGSEGTKRSGSSRVSFIPRPPNPGADPA